MLNLKKVLSKLLIFIFFISVSNNILAQRSPIFKAANIKSNMIRVADWQFKHSNGKPENTWTNATFYAGVFSAYKTTGSAILLDSLMVISTRNNWLPGKRYDHADDIAITQTYIDLYRISPDKKMIQSSIDSIEKMRVLPGNEIKKHGINWWWCDALFMAPPTLAKLSKTLNDPSYLVLSDSLYRECYRLL